MLTVGCFEGIGSRISTILVCSRLAEPNRIGWKFAGGHSEAFAFVTDLGDTLVLTRLAFAALDIQLTAAYGRASERRLAVMWGAISD